jgi:subtilisin family serine protease
VLTAITIAVTAGHVSAAKRPFSRKLDSALAGVAGKGGHRTRVIVRLREGAGTSVREALRRSKSHVRYTHDSISAVTMNLGSDDLEPIADLDEVESVSIDAPVEALATPIPATTGVALRRTLGISSHADLEGRGVGVAVIDSGISPLPVFERRIRAFYDFTRGGISARPYDDYGHGTHVAGLIAGGPPSLMSRTSWNGPTYLTLTGTSMAAAVTSGVVALVLEANADSSYRRSSSLTPNAIKAILLYTALPMRDASGIAYDRLTQGAGSLNADGALPLARAIDANASRNRYWLTRGVAPVSYIEGSQPWSQLVIWSSNLVWGDSVLRNLRAWDENVIWGDSILGQ